MKSIKKCPKGSILNKKTNRCNKIKIKTEKKCPKGSILNKKTNRCNKIKIKKVSSKKLFNPITKRYIINNSKNRKKLNIKKTSNIKINTKILTKDCNKYNNIKYIDLNKIKLIEDKSNICKNRPIGENDLFKINEGSILNNNYIYFTLIYEKIPICNSTFLNKGAYGKVYEYSNKSDINIAIKSFKYSNDNEIKIINRLNKLNINCNTINAKILKIGKGNKSKQFAIMNKMAGGLNKMNGKLDIKNIYLVIKQIAEHLKCLNDNNLSYTDLKTANILFKCINKIELVTVLGDLGSICNKNSYNPCTWLPWDQKNTRSQMPKCIESTMVWCLGVVFLELLKYSEINIFSWQYIPELNKNEMMNILNKINLKYKFVNNKFTNSTKYKNGEELFYGIFNLNNKNRITLNEIINTIKFNV